MVNLSLSLTDSERLKNSLFDQITRFFQWPYNEKIYQENPVEPLHTMPGLPQTEWNLDQGLIDIYKRDFYMIISRLMPPTLLKFLCKLQRVTLIYLYIDGTEDDDVSYTGLRQNPADIFSDGHRISLSGSYLNDSKMTDFRDWISRSLFTLRLFSMAGLRIVIYRPLHRGLFPLFQTCPRIAIPGFLESDRIKLKSACLFHKRN